MAATPVLADYHLRVGQVTADTRLPPGQVLREQRLDETETGAATTITLLDAQRPVAGADPADLAADLGLEQGAGLVGWDVFDAVLTPGDVILMLAWRDRAAAEAYEAGAAAPGRRAAPPGPGDPGLRHVRPPREPQFYPEVSR